MDVYHHRRENVRQLCRKEHNGSLSKMANKLDRQQSLISRWIGKTKNPKPIGSRTARRIEHEYKKPDGWLDVPHDVLQIKEEQAIYGSASMDEKRAALSDESVVFAEHFELMPEHIKQHLCLLINDVLIMEHGSKELQKAYVAASIEDQLHFNRNLKASRKKSVKKKRKKK